MYISRVEKYDKRLLEGRVEVEAAVIAAVANDMLLLDDYMLDSSMFVTKDGLFLFKVMEKLRSKNINQITDFDVMNINENVYEKFQDLGGMKLIEDMKERVDVSNFTSYFDELYKHNAILQMSDVGWDFTKKIKFNGNEIIPIDFFKKCTSQELRDFLDYHVNEVSVFDLEGGIEEEVINLTEEFLNSCYEGEEHGVPFDRAGTDDIDNEDILTFPGISKQIGGYLRGTLNLIGAYSNMGKSTMTTSMAMSFIEEGSKILMISNEQKSKPFKFSFLFWILCNRLKYYKLTRNKLKTGNVTEEDKEMLNRAIKIWQEEYKGKVYFVSLNEANMKTVSKKIRQYSLQYGCDVVIYDTFKADFENQSNEAMHLALIKDSRELHKVCKKYDLIGIATMQLAQNTLGRLWLDASCLSQSKQVIEILETLILFRNTYNEEEFNPKSKYFCNPFRRQKIGDRWVDTPVEIDKSHTYRIMFITKAREGDTSENTGEAYLYRFDGSKAKFTEVCKCKPKHGNI